MLTQLSLFVTPDSKTCTRCREEKRISDFSWKSGGRRDTQCKPCKRIAIKAAYERNKAPYIARAKACTIRRRVEFKAYVDELKRRPCSDCHQVFPPCVMDFDHRDGAAKVKEVSRIVGAASSMTGLLAEIAKCDLVCANCHRIRTHNRRVANKRVQILPY